MLKRFKKCLQSLTFNYFVTHGTGPNDALIKLVSFMKKLFENPLFVAVRRKQVLDTEERGVMEAVDPKSH